MEVSNQINESVTFINQGIPIYINKCYNAFKNLENEYYTRIMKLADSSKKHTFKEYVERIFSNVYKYPFLTKLDLLLGANKNMIVYIRKELLENGRTTVSFNNETENKSGIEYISELGDIVAPVTEMKSVMLPNFKNYYMVNKVILPTLFFQPVVQHKSMFINSYNHGINLDFDEAKNIFNCLYSEMCVNISDVLNNFDILAIEGSRFKIDQDKLITDALRNGEDEENKDIFDSNDKSSDNSDQETVFKNLVKKFEKYHEYINSAEGKEFITSTLTKALKKTAINTYMVYVGGLLGNKKDIYDWLYTSIIKDAVNKIESGVYPTSVGLDNIEDVEDIDNGSLPIRRIPLSRVDSGIGPYGSINKEQGFEIEYRRVILRNLRIKYSNWAHVINTITHINKDKNDEKFKTKRLAEIVLNEFISLYYRTYNIISDDNSLTARVKTTNVSDFINKSIKRVTCPVVAELLKENDVKFNSKETKHFSDKYLSSSDKITSFFRTEELGIKVLRSLFLNASYFMMLEHLEKLDKSILNTEDPLTGRPKKELYREVQVSIYQNINQILSKYTKNFDSDDKIAEYKLYNVFHKSKVMTSDGVNEVERNIITASKKLPIMEAAISQDFSNEIRKYSDLISSYYYISPIRECLKIKNDFDWDKPNFYSSDDSITDTLFYHSRKNKDLLNLHYDIPNLHFVEESMGVIDYNNVKYFKDAETAMESLQDLSIRVNSGESEWGGTLHSDLASIGGSVTEYVTKPLPPEEYQTDEEKLKEFEDEHIENEESEQSKENFIEDFYDAMFCDVVLGKSYENFLPELKNIIITNKSEESNIFENELNSLQGSQKSEYSDFIDGLLN